VGNDLCLPWKKMTRNAIAGIMATLKILLPTIVAKPAENPSISRKRKRKMLEINNSGRELAAAFIVGPLMPGFKFLVR